MAIKSAAYNEMCFAVYTTNRYFHKIYSELLGPFDLTYLQYMVLLIVDQDEETTMTEICAQLDIENNTMTPVVQKLVKKGWLLREKSAVDARVSQLRFNPARCDDYRQLQMSILEVQQAFTSATDDPIQIQIENQHRLNGQLANLVEKIKEMRGK